MIRVLGKFFNWSNMPVPPLRQALGLSVVCNASNSRVYADSTRCSYWKSVQNKSPWQNQAIQKAIRAISNRNHRAHWKNDQSIYWDIDGHFIYSTFIAHFPTQYIMCVRGWCAWIFVDFWCEKELYGVIKHVVPFKKCNIAWHFRLALSTDAFVDENC